MIRKLILRTMSLLVPGLWALWPGLAQACPVCYGAPDSPLTAGMNLAILTMIGIIGFILSSFVIFFIYLRRRAMQTHAG
ncbi:MAG: hypothetical protein D6814_15485 [Calditrichaeota bacterium]|nr:MAG: hypothetical protein D6814_15485 [Calditrichota bacterium]